MWGFQPHFRISLEVAAKESLNSIGALVAPTVLLIGFAEDPNARPICVEPENFGIAPDVFVDCLTAGDAAYERHENRTIISTDPDLDARYHAGLLDNCRAAAVAKALNSAAPHDQRRWFVGNSERVGQYRVYPVIGVLRARWDALPTLRVRDHDHRIEMYLSLQEAVVRKLLGIASFALHWSEQPQGLLSDDRAEVVGRASGEFIRQLVYFKGRFWGADLYSAMNLVAAQPYEGRTGVGTMLVSASTDYHSNCSSRAPLS